MFGSSLLPKPLSLLWQLRTRLEGAIADPKKKLSEVDFSDQPLTQSQAAAKDYRADCQKRMGVLSAMLKPAKEDLKKIEKSPNKDAFEIQFQQLNDLVNQGTDLAQLLSMMPVANPEPEQFLVCLEKCESLTFLGKKGLGPGFAMKSLMARANEACIHRDFEMFCAILSGNSSVSEKLAEEMGEDQLCAFVAVEVENRLMSALRSITSEELQSKASGRVSEEDTPNILEACHLAEASVDACDRPHFLAKEVRNSASMAYVLLDMRDIADLQRAVQEIQHFDSKQAQQDAGGMVRFFLQHEIGKDLMAMAVERVTTGEAEAEYQNLVSDLVIPLLELEALVTPIREGHGPSQTQGVQAIVKNRTVWKVFLR